MAYAGPAQPQAPQQGGGLLEMLMQLGLITPPGQAGPLLPAAQDVPGQDLPFGIGGVPQQPYPGPVAPASVKLPDRLPGGGPNIYTPGGAPNVQAPEVDGGVYAGTGGSPIAGYNPQAAVPYAGTGGAPGGAYNPQGPVDVPAGIAEPDGAPPIGGSAAPAQAAPNGMDALVQALSGLTAPPQRPPVSVATPPPPRAAPGGGGDILAALMAMGGMGRGGGPAIPPLGSLIGR